MIINKVYIAVKNNSIRKLIGLIILIFFSLVSQAQNKEITIVAVGDIMMGTTFPSKNYLPPENTNPFKNVATALKGDLVFGNLEGTLTDTGKNAKSCKDPNKCYSFKMPEKYVNFLTQAGFNVMSIANNHIGDFGQTGIKNTIKTLKNNGIHFAGVIGYESTIFEKDGIKYGFCAFSPNNDTAKLNDLKKAIETVKKLKSEGADIIIVSFHGGAEGSKYTHVPRKTEFFYGENRGNVYKFAHAMIDAGADVVLGSGPHVPRAIDIYKNKFIIYSLGNFCTYGRFSLSGVKGYAPILKITVDNKGNFLNGKIISAKQKSRVYPYIDKQQSAFKLIKKLTKEDFPEIPLIFNDDGSFYLKQ